MIAYIEINHHTSLSFTNVSNCSFPFCLIPRRQSTDDSFMTSLLCSLVRSVHPLSNGFPILFSVEIILFSWFENLCYVALFWSWWQVGGMLLDVFLSKVASNSEITPISGPAKAHCNSESVSCVRSMIPPSPFITALFVSLINSNAWKWALRIWHGEFTLFKFCCHI